MALDFFNKKKELACKCCGLANVDDKFYALLNEARSNSSVPFVIVSGCRCVTHNKKVGGKAESAHIATNDRKSFAVDIKATDSRSRYEILRSLIAVGFTRIGIAKTFIHVDLDPSKDERVVWVY